MFIRTAQEQDLSRIMEIYAHARAFMAAHGNPRQWGMTNWPPEALIRQDIQQQKCYVCTQEGNIAGVFYYDYGTRIEKAYAQLEGGHWEGSDTYGVVHRIASDAKGVGRFCLQWAFDQCQNLRIDTHGDNTVMQSLLDSMGFRYRGVMYVEEDNDPRIAYEKFSCPKCCTSE